MSEIYLLDPLSDPRWDELVGRHPDASVFHERGWLEALTRTYRYEPLVLTTAPPGKPLENGIAICHVSSWMTGTRLVSLPFSDHCEPLVDSGTELLELLKCLQTECDLQQLRYVELRPVSTAVPSAGGWQSSSSYWFHELDLGARLDEIFCRLHVNSFQRKVLRAERERLSYQSGCSEELLGEFYRLLLITRKRHQLLPPPSGWFRNLLECMSDKLQIRVARKKGVPIAAIMTLRHRSSVVYKYGCSDERFHNLGGMPFLFWRLFEESRVSGVEKVDFGRTDLSNAGLIAFKDRIGATRRLLTYYRYAKTAKSTVATLSSSQAVRRFVSFLPKVASSAAGRALYRHMG